MRREFSYTREESVFDPTLFLWEIGMLCLVTLLIFPHQMKYSMLYFVPAGAYLIMCMLPEAYYLHTRQNQELKSNPTVFRYGDYLFVVMKGVFEYTSKPFFVSFPGETRSGSVANKRTEDALIFICIKRAQITAIER